VVLAVILVRFLSYNIQSLWLPSGEAVVQNQWAPLGCSLVLLGLVLSDGDSIYVTGTDLGFFWSTVGYVGIYLGIHATSRASRASSISEMMTNYEQPVFNVIVGTLQLVAMRFYTAAETPYNTVLVGMLASRGWTKLLVHQHQSHASLLLDSLYLSLCIELAFDGTRELLVGVIGVAFMAGQLLSA
jgi:hypothetical protein